MKKITLFAGYNNNNMIPDYVVHYIKNLSKISDVYYLADCTTLNSELKKISPFVKRAYSFKHYKYDFGSWQELINILGYDELAKYEQLILCNDSCFAPMFDLNIMFNIMNKKSIDFWGPTLNNYDGIEHLQSYFLVFNKNVFLSKQFKNFFEKIKIEKDKMQVIYNYELKLTEYLNKAGFKYLSYIDNSNINIKSSKKETLNNNDPCYCWKQLLLNQSPFIKVGIFTFLKNCIYIENTFFWEDFIHRNSYYDTNLIKKHLLYLKKNKLIKQYKISYIIKKIIRELKFLIQRKQNKVKYIPLYLPQFHAFKENDEWWGEGFTEWTNTKPAVPFFEGHYQPHEPHDDIGYYDLSDVNVMIKQAKMAKEYGIYGFSYYYYWFNGKKLMEKPLENMLNNKDVDIPFCLFWANHNWTRSWDAGNKEILLEQTYDESTNEKFIDDLIPYFKDERYIRIDKKPVLLIYQADHLPNPKQTVKEWRKIAKNKYNLELYLVTVQQNNSIPPAMFGYDAALETTPNYTAGKTSLLDLDKQPVLPKDVTMTFYDYKKDIFAQILKKKENYKKFSCVYPMWDNSPRRKKKLAWMFYGATPELFEKFLIEMTKKTINKFEEKEQFLFINAWNEWAEGTHLEPDKKYGYTYLDICKKVKNMSVNDLKKNGFNTQTKKYMNKILNGTWYIKILMKLNPISKVKINDKRIIKFLGITIYSYNK